MTKSDLESMLGQAVANLFRHQPNIFKFTSETGQTEWNLAHHLAIEAHEYFSGLDCDLDVIKLNYENRRPDIIFHKRGTNESNYLVIEVKRDGNPKKVNNDIKKIQAYWFRDPLHYQFGAVINLRADGEHQITVFKNAN